MRTIISTMLLVGMAAVASAKDPRISFEIVTRPGTPPTAAQQWYQALSKLGITGLQIRSGNDEMELKKTGTPAAPAYRVTGVLGSDNVLYVPGGKFGVRDTAKLKQWMDDLGSDGVEGVTTARGAFGMTPSQLEFVHSDLKQPVGFSTKGMPADQAITQIARRLHGRIRPVAGAAGTLRRITLEDEFEDLSCGTALAAIVRPAGLVVTPRKSSSGSLEYELAKPVRGQESWPVGFKPSKRAADELPLLFEMLNVEISEIPVSEAIEAVGGRLEVPLIFDRNAMALHGSDPTTAPAEVPEKRMSYSQVLSKVLSQAGLRYELRVDEADKPFLWITTTKPAP